MGHTRTVCSGTIAGTPSSLPPSPSPSHFFRVDSDWSHNTSKVTKAEGKQIRGRALTGLLNTRAPRRWSSSSLKVATTRPIGTTATSTPAWSSSGAQACTASCVLLPAFLRGRRGIFTAHLSDVRETKAILVEEWEVRTKEESNTRGKPSSLLSRRAAGKRFRTRHKRADISARFAFWIVAGSSIGPIDSIAARFQGFLGNANLASTVFLIVPLSARCARSVGPRDIDISAGAACTTGDFDEVHRGIFPRPLVSPSDLRPTKEIKGKQGPESDLDAYWVVVLGSAGFTGHIMGQTGTPA